MREFEDIIENFKERRILVVGDIILDEYIFGSVSRISPEAPVPVLHARKKEYRLGGAANVANNIASLGGKAIIIGLIGYDKTGKELEDEIKKKKIEYFLIKKKDFETIKKTRIIAQTQQIVRVDHEDTKNIDINDAKSVIKFISKKKIDLIIISDYNKGVIIPCLVDELKKTGIRIIVDPRPENISLYKGVYAITPNFDEAMRITGEKEINKIGDKIIKDFDTNLILTQGKDGASLFDKTSKEHYYVPTKAKEVYDVSGAGDTFIAALSLAIASNASLYESLILANFAAGISVSKLGTATVTKNEMLNSLTDTDRKIKNLKEIKGIVDDLKLKGRKIVFTNGCFDIIHQGHIKLLKEAKKQGDILIVGLNSDKSVKRLKGENRPINSEKEREEMMASFEFVDYVTIFEETTPEKIVSLIRPDVHVKGGDYNPNDYKRMPEAKIVHGYGGKVHIVNIIDGKSTTDIIKRMNEDE